VQVGAQTMTPDTKLDSFHDLMLVMGTSYKKNINLRRQHYGDKESLSEKLRIGQVVTKFPAS
jgi:hypothetical protein